MKIGLLAFSCLRLSTAVYSQLVVTNSNIKEVAGTIIIAFTDDNNKPVTE
jgi:hypothetical protein